ncbi:hypothetical protein A2U01_0034956 [Trifolium medium]|uniref:Uncharacterized protein n=1 Tax=Trifolium medium TaxID=97028 RepID=A0A392PSD9_9FABA|nr:hypothetical protein [Trifolium medium]
MRITMVVENFSKKKSGKLHQEDFGFIGINAQAYTLQIVVKCWNDNSASAVTKWSKYYLVMSNDRRSESNVRKYETMCDTVRESIDQGCNDTVKRMTVSSRIRVRSTESVEDVVSKLAFRPTNL